MTFKGARAVKLWESSKGIFRVGWGWCRAENPPPWTGVEELTSDFFRGERRQAKFVRHFFVNLGPFKGVYTFVPGTLNKQF